MAVGELLFGVVSVSLYNRPVSVAAMDISASQLEQSTDSSEWAQCLDIVGVGGRNAHGQWCSHALGQHTQL